MGTKDVAGELENIAASIEVLQRRAMAVQQMRHLMTAHYRDVLETPDLQRIIENNTWLFGPRYETLGAEEDRFTDIVRKLRDQVQGPTKDEDGDGACEIPGGNRQADLFLARKFPTFDSFGQQIYKCIVVEIKRPAVSLNKRHLRQLEDYAEIIKSVPEFQSERMHFELILIGRQFASNDVLIKSRLNGAAGRGEMGLVSDDPRMKLYVMNWYSLLDSFDLTNGFMLEKLKMKRAELESKTKSQLVAELQVAH